jgi:hypothetical protein
MKKAIVQKVKGHWHITSIGLTDGEIEGLRYQLNAHDIDPKYEIRTRYEIIYR